MSPSAFVRVATLTFQQSKSMPRVGAGKNPLAGFALGFLFGPFGVGLYLGSFADFAITLFLVIVGSVFTAGIAAPVLWCLCGAWAAVRIKNSNQALGGHSTLS